MAPADDDADAAEPTGAPRVEAPSAAVRATLARYPEHLIAAARQIFAALRSAERVLVAAEPIPDGDAIGASVAAEHIAVAAFARPGGRAGASVHVLAEHGCPPRYRFLARSGRVQALADLAPAPRFDLALVVDGGAERLGGPVDRVFEQAARKVYVDHHKFGSRRAYDLRLADPAATSTTQLLWLFFADPEIAVPLDVEVAEALYLGLIYDTGSYQYPSTQPLTHEIAACLMETGLDFARVHERALLVQPLAEMLEHARLLASARCALGGRVAFAVAGPQDLTASAGDYAKAIQVLSFVDGCEAVFVLHEREPGRFRVSLRSRGRVDVGGLARALDPGGGGHARAAGCELAGQTDDVVAHVVAALGAKLDALP